MSHPRGDGGGQRHAEPTSGQRILMVEDSPTQAESLRALLADAGYDVITAPNGQAGLTEFAAHECDVVISDVVMPGEVDGYELCRRIKTGQRREVPVVLLTSLSDPLDIIRGLECGADNFLTKPYEPDHLLERLRTVIATRATRGAAKLRMGVKVLFMGREFTISSEREQILDLLISTFEDAVRQNRELRHREEALEATNRELEAFTYSLSHDLRAPLRHADAFSGLLLEECSAQLDAVAQGYIQRFRQAVELMDRMVTALLQLGQVGRRDLRPRPTALRSLVDGVLSMIEGQTQGRRVTWEIGPLPVVVCDRELMESVFTNLLSNAVKFTRDRDPAVIQVGETVLRGQPVIFVRDNGAGFDPRYAEKLFGIFQRLHPAGEFEGTGVGLATVQRIIHKHGGQVWAEAELGKGAAIYFTLARGQSPGASSGPEPAEVT